MDANRGGQKEHKYRSIHRCPWGKYAMEIRNPNRNGARLWLGTFEMAEEATGAYDRAAHALKGHQTILNFPNDGHYRNAVLIFIGINSQARSSQLLSHAALSSYQAANKSLPVEAASGKHVIELEYFDDNLLEKLLGTQVRGQDKPKFG